MRIPCPAISRAPREDQAYNLGERIANSRVSSCHVQEVCVPVDSTDTEYNREDDDGLNHGEREEDGNDNSDSGDESESNKRSFERLWTFKSEVPLSPLLLVCYESYDFTSSKHGYTYQPGTLFNLHHNMLFQDIRSGLFHSMSKCGICFIIGTNSKEQVRIVISG
jgi:hypothetical protein